MRILVNDQELDFTLEGGEKLGEVFDSLVEDLKQQNLFVKEVKVDGVSVDLFSDERWRSKEPEEISVIEVSVAPVGELLATTLVEGVSLASTLKRAKDEAPEKVSEAVKWLIDLVGYIKELFPEMASENLEMALEVISEPPTWDARWEEALNEIQFFLTGVFSNRIMPMYTPEERKKGALTMAKSLVENYIPQVVDVLRAGALPDLTPLINSLQVIAAGIDKKEVVEDLRGRMDKFRDALKKRDLILMADVLENDIKDFMENLESLL